MFLHTGDWVMASGDGTERRAPRRRRDEDDRPEPTEEIDGDDVVAEWSYDTTNPPRTPRRGNTPPHRQRLRPTPHAF